MQAFDLHVIRYGRFATRVSDSVHTSDVVLPTIKFDKSDTRPCDRIYKRLRCVVREKPHPPTQSNTDVITSKVTEVTKVTNGDTILTRILKFMSILENNPSTASHDFRRAVRGKAHHN